MWEVWRTPQGQRGGLEGVGNVGIRHPGFRSGFLSGHRSDAPLWSTLHLLGRPTTKIAKPISSSSTKSRQPPVGISGNISTNL